MVAEWWFKSACGHNSSKKGSRRFFPNVLGDTKKIRQCSHNWNWSRLLSSRAFIRLAGSNPAHCAAFKLCFLMTQIVYALNEKVWESRQDLKIGELA